MFIDNERVKIMNKTIELTAPKSWKELNPKQLQYAAWLLSLSNITEEEIWTYAFVRFSKIKLKRKNGNEYIFKYKKQQFFLTDEEVLSFAKQFCYLTSGIDEITPLPKLARLRHSDARLRGCNLSQYLAIENYYQAFIFTKKEEFLNNLCTAFYIKGDFDDTKTAKRARSFAKLPFHSRYTVFLWFSGLKKVLKNHFPNYFVEMEADPDQEPTPPNMRKQIEQMMRALSGGDVTKVNAIYGVETWTALAELDAKALEYKIMKSKMKK